MIKSESKGLRDLESYQAYHCSLLHKMARMMRIVEGLMERFARSVAFAALFVLILGLAAPLADGEDAPTQNTDVVFLPYPLRPPDTSSPRDTLHSFLTNASIVLKDWHRGAMSPAGYQAYSNALRTLDFSTTPHRDSWSVRTERFGLLMEILNRIEQPPEDEIPGDHEVAGGVIKQWTIPDTEITIERIEEGPRAGEFLFSDSTVERLDTFYRKAKHLPLKPDSQVEVYEAFLRSDRTVHARELQLRNRLMKADTSNPRSTLEGFLDSVNRAHALVMEANAALTAKRPTMTMAEARKIEIQAGNLLRRATSTLDLSQVPEVHRQDIGIESVLMLKEILDRMMLPPVDSIPNEEMVEAARQQRNRSTTGTVEPIRWRYPNTEIEIVEIVEGERQGQFLFTAGTVSRIRDYYNAVQDLSYRGDDYGILSLDYLSPDKSEGFYDYYVSTPGYLVHRASFLGRLVDELPGWLKTVHGGEAIWQWIALLFCVLATAWGGYAVFRVMRRLEGRLKSPLGGWLMILAPTLVAVIVMQVVRFIDEQINITGNVVGTVMAGEEAIVAALAIWAIFRLFRAIAETIIASPRIPDTSVDASLLRVGTRIIGFLIGVWIVIYSIRHLGADVVPLLAGLGVGGLAVALAAQKTIANFIGSLILFANKPVSVGDFCRYGGDKIGTIEEIGLISTRIRSLERTIVTVPNAEFSEMQLDNFTMRDQRLLNTVLQLRYETTPEQMRYVLVKLRELLLGHPMVTPDPARVRFVGYGTYSKEVEVFAYLQCKDQNTFLAIQEDLLLRMEDIINEAGTGFAIPSQTAYLTQDTGLDAEGQEKAETQVEQWRVSGKLPFPEFEDKERKQLEDTLDYPPKGSPDYEPHTGSLGQQQETQVTIPIRRRRAGRRPGSRSKRS